MLEPVWAWGVLGLVLLAIELATGTFYVLWFGVAGLCMSLIVSLFPNIPHAYQYLIFAVLSIASLSLWKATYKPKPALKVGQSQGEEIGRVGTIIVTAGPRQNGRIQFTQGLMGSREWTALSEVLIEEGSEAEVVSVEGNSLRVRKVI